MPLVILCEDTFTILKDHPGLTILGCKQKWMVYEAHKLYSKHIFCVGQDSDKYVLVWHWPGSLLQSKANIFGRRVAVRADSKSELYLHSARWRHIAKFGLVELKLSFSDCLTRQMSAIFVFTTDQPIYKIEFLWLGHQNHLTNKRYVSVNNVSDVAEPIWLVGRGNNGVTKHDPQHLQFTISHLIIIPPSACTLQSQEIQICLRCILDWIRPSFSFYRLTIETLPYENKLQKLWMRFGCYWSPDSLLNFCDFFWLSTRESLLTSTDF